jgi:hypothetical protein
MNLRNVGRTAAHVENVHVQLPWLHCQKQPPSVSQVCAWRAVRGRMERLACSPCNSMPEARSAALAALPETTTVPHVPQCHRATRASRHLWPGSRQTAVLKYGATFEVQCHSATHASLTTCVGIAPNMRASSRRVGIVPNIQCRAKHTCLTTCVIPCSPGPCSSVPIAA